MLAHAHARTQPLFTNTQVAELLRPPGDLGLSACPRSLAPGPPMLVVSDTALLLTAFNCSEGYIYSLEKVGEAGCLANADL